MVILNEQALVLSNQKQFIHIGDQHIQDNTITHPHWDIVDIQSVALEQILDCSVIGEWNILGTIGTVSLLCEPTK